MHGIQALTTIPDPRRRRGRHSPLFGLLAIVLRAAMHPRPPACGFSLPISVLSICVPLTR